MGRCIWVPGRDAFIRFSEGTINEVFNLETGFDMPLSFGELDEEYRQMDTTYLGGKLEIHRKEPGILTEQDGLPFNFELFRHYFQYTYMSCRQLGGVEVPDLMNIGPMVLASNIQMYEPRPFDYACYLVNKIHEVFLNLQENPSPHFKLYSLLMHIVLFYRCFSGNVAQRTNFAY